MIQDMKYAAVLYHSVTNVLSHQMDFFQLHVFIFMQ